MMKPAIPPVRSTLHKAWSEGCRMWAPMVLPVKKSSQVADRVGAVTNDPLPTGTGNDKESAATAAGINP